jgi:beta-N-acetylhexosaminidase
MTVQATIFGIEGTVLSANERDFFKDSVPFGFILFKRNCVSPEQVRALTDQLRDCLGRPLPVLIDQEGGRVQRLAPPIWPARPAPRQFGELYAQNPAAGCRAAHLNALLMAAELADLGINVNCVPDLDLGHADGHPAVIGDRVYGDDPALVTALGRAVADGMMAGGVLPVIKHLPGHGRAHLDTHFDLPRIEASLADLEKTDFLPFRALADLPMAMTGHLVMAAIDDRQPATTSAKLIAETIRAWMGFNGLLMSDDLSMQALTGDLTKRAADSLAAGCDIALHCNGDMPEMLAVAAGAVQLEGAAEKRAMWVIDDLAQVANGSYDLVAADAELTDLMAMRDAS